MGLVLRLLSVTLFEGQLVWNFPWAMVVQFMLNIFTTRQELTISYIDETKPLGVRRRVLARLNGIGVR